MRSIGIRLLCLPVVAVLVSCTAEAKSPIVQKLETSELHELGSSCAGAFIAFDGKDLVTVDPDTGRNGFFQKDVTFTDIGDDRVTITSKSKTRNIVFRFHLNSDKTLMTYEAVHLDPPRTPEELANMGLKAKYEEMDRAMRAIPQLVLCPKKTI